MAYSAESERHSLASNTASGNGSYGLTIERLDELLAEWHRAGQPPEAVDLLMECEYQALVLAMDCDWLLGHSPVAVFLSLDKWLQRWVLETRGWQLFAQKSVKI